MVMGLLRGAIIFSGTCEIIISTIYETGHEFGCTRNTYSHCSDFTYISAQNWQARVATIFINRWSWASVWCHYVVRHMLEYNQHNLPDRRRIWVYRKGIASLFQILRWNMAVISRGVNTLRIRFV